MYFLAIATNIPQRLKTGFVLQGHNIECVGIHTNTILNTVAIILNMQIN